MEESMKKSIICIFMFISLLFSSAQFVRASDSFSEENEININEVVKNPDEYPDIEIIKQTAEEFKETLFNDENISSEDRNNIINDVNQNSRSRASSTYDYWTFYTTCSVTSSYSCKPYFYTYTNFNGPSHEPSQFVKVYYGNIDRNWKGTTKQFTGSLYYKLESSKKIFWDLNGDFYNNGTTSSTTGGQVGLGEFANTSFSVSYSTNHYAYVHKSGRYSI